MCIRDSGGVEATARCAFLDLRSPVQPRDQRGNPALPARTRASSRQGKRTETPGKSARQPAAARASQ
eukprot:12987899-Alexandrium_andersonii.AAC.1